MFKSILKLSAAGLAAYLFSPVLAAGLLALFGHKLSGFLVFQIFIEGFVVWQLAIGIVLHESGNRNFALFLGLMVFGILYRLSTTIHQFSEYLSSGKFDFVHVPAWVVPFHLLATFGMVYCFRLNADWILHSERAAGPDSNASRWGTFFALLIFPVGLWSVQPRLNAIMRRDRTAA